MTRAAAGWPADENNVYTDRMWRKLMRLSYVAPIAAHLLILFEHKLQPGIGNPAS